MSGWSPGVKRKQAIVKHDHWKMPTQNTCMTKFLQMLTQNNMHLPQKFDAFLLNTMSYNNSLQAKAIHNFAMLQHIQER